jgi:hypothetical protein
MDERHPAGASEAHIDASLDAPAVWGPHLWRALHLIALGYPQRPTVHDRAAYRAFFEQLDRVIPCGTCAANYRRHLVELPLEPSALQGGPGDTLFAWTVRLHNLVNAELGSANGSDWTPERAKSALARGDAVPPRDGGTPAGDGVAVPCLPWPLCMAVIVLVAAVLLSAFFFLRSRGGRSTMSKK